MKKLFYAGLICLASVSVSCSSKGNSDATKIEVENTEMATQPVECGQYLASNYEIQGKDARKGAFDGRVIFSISGDQQSAIYVYENGNRAKIDYMILLDHPFEMGDSGVYRTNDTKGLPVTIATDSINYVLGFSKAEQEVKISFEKSPKSTGSALDMLEKINSIKSKR